MKKFVICFLEYIVGKRIVFMTQEQFARWEVYKKINCDVRYGDALAKSKIAKVGPIGDETRAYIEKRSGGECEIKSKFFSRKAYDIHHVIYRRYGGTNEVENLRNTCGSCHKRIHAADPVEKKEKESIGDSIARKIKW